MDRYLAEFRFTSKCGSINSGWTVMEGETPTSMADVVNLIAEHHEAHTGHRNNSAGLFRCAVLQDDTGTWRDVTEEALDAFGRWHLEARDSWPWFLDAPAWVEAAA